MLQRLKCAMVAALIATGAVADVSQDSAPESGSLWDKTLEYAGAGLDGARRLWREEQATAARLWEDLTPYLEEILTLQDRQRELPESAWFGEDQASSAEEINALLDEAAAILVGNNALRARVQELALAMAENRHAIGELKRRKISAPSNSLWRKTVRDIEEEIAERKQVLAEQRRALSEVQHATAAGLREMGLDVDAEGLEFLLSTVVGDDVVDMTLAFEQVRGLTAQLEALTAESREDLPVARRYYGMYTVLLGILNRMHSGLIDGIDRDYLPRIGAIGERARSLQKKTLSLQARTPSAVLQANLKAQQLTIDATRRYADYLVRQRQQVAASQERLAHDLAVASNTYETVKMSGDLAALLRDSQQLLDTLFRLQVPPLRAFENAQMRREFERLTIRLREDEAG